MEMPQPACRFAVWARLRLATVLLVTGLMAAVHAAAAQGLNRDAADDAEWFRNQAIFAVPHAATPGPDDNLFATAPDAEHLPPAPRLNLNVLAPLYFNSNAQALSSGGSAALEGSPLIRLSGSGQLGDLPLRLSGSVSTEWDRFANASDADFDKLRIRLQLQYIDKNNDQALSPFIAYVPRLDFEPTFAREFATRQDLDVGVSKALNFDAGFHRLPISGDSAGSAVWSLGLTLMGQRRFRSPAPSSYAVEILPSLSHVISDEWSFVFGVDILPRWFDATAGVSQRDLTVEPIAVLAYNLPARWFGGATRARWFGSPTVDFVAGYERTWSNVSGGTFSQWVTGLTINAGWRF